MKLSYDRARNIVYLRQRPKGAEVGTIRVSDELNVDNIGRRRNAELDMHEL